MKRKIVGAVVIVFMFAFSAAYAGPVDTSLVSNDQDGVIWASQPAGDNLLSDVVLSVAGEVSYLPERELDVAGGLAEAGFAHAKFILTLNKRYNIYLTVGNIINPEFSFHKTTTGNGARDAQVIYKFQNDTAIGGGLSAIIQEWEDMGLKLLGDIAYRHSDLDIDTLHVDGIEYDSSALNTDEGGEWSEWHAALTVTKDMGMFTPYAGVKYSDVSMTASSSFNTQDTWNMDEVESSEKVGVFAGISIEPMKAVSIDLQGSFIDESSVSASVKVKF